MFIPLKELLATRRGSVPIQSYICYNHGKDAVIIPRRFPRGRAKNNVPSGRSRNPRSGRMSFRSHETSTESPDRGGNLA